MVDADSASISGGSGGSGGTGPAIADEGTSGSDDTADGGGSGSASASAGDADGTADGDAGCVEEPEICNGEDDDCDGDIDEGLDVEVACGQGICETMAPACADGVPIDCVPGEPNPEGETCDGTDDDCDGDVDEGCDCIDGETQACYSSNPARVDVGECQEGTQTCADGQWGACVDDVTPTAEICDGLDNNCDGTDDEGDPDGGAACDTGLAGICSAGTEACVDGAIACEQDDVAGVEVCNGDDDDCDGVPDNGNPGGGGACDTGFPGACGPGTEACVGGGIVCEADAAAAVEVCNGFDEDCDGVPDNGNPGGGGACVTGLLGACAAGTDACVGGGIVCQQDVAAGPEVCNGADEDCDGVDDNGNPGSGGACNTGLLGECSAGTELCFGGGIVCQQNGPAVGEVCDGLDNDCDGVDDNGNPGGGAACNTGLLGVCAAGTEACSGGGIVCQQDTPSAAESCNGEDDDCDGGVDEGNPDGGAACDTGLLGECANGFEFCSGGGLVCQQTVFPAIEICANGLDENCDGVADDNTDDDGDGWGVCDNDCCDVVGTACASPSVVNPGAFEEPGNGVDDDCDGMIDNPVALCGVGLASNSNNPLDYTRAIDLCQFTTESPPLDQQIWGVIDAQLLLANESGPPNANARSIRPVFGGANVPQLGSNFAVLSTGFAAAPGQINPPHGGWEPGNDMGTDVPAPAAWLAANGGSFPNAPGCSISANTNAHDSVLFRARIRVPTNANSFSVDMYFMSAEYPEYVCTDFNDMFITLVTSTDPGNPADDNIAIYDDGVNQWPVGVNLVSAAPGLFTECDNGVISCAGGVPQNYAGCTSEAGLTGTGFDADAAACAGNDDVGGATGWLNMSGNVTPGETMEIRFVIWDTADSVWDSVVLLDNWQWSVDASEPGIGGG